MSKNAKYAYLMAALDMMSQGLEPSLALSVNKPETKRDKKKCKSCALFHKHNDYRSSCEKFKYKDPWDVACEYYQKRKK